MNVYDSTLHTFQPNSIYGVRVMEGFSSEEGFPRMFGTTMFEGHANLGVAQVAAGRQLAREGPGERADAPPDGRQVRYVAVQRAGVVLGSPR